MLRFLTALVLVGIGFVSIGAGRAEAQETLTVTFTPTSTGGSYAPKNIDVVWVNDSGGTFVRTIGRWANSRRTHLIAWRAAAGTTDVDAIAGASQTSFHSLTATWDLTDRTGTVIPDGTYTIRIESCDSNASSEGQNHQGTFSFVKNGTASSQSTSGGGFNGVMITYSGRTAPVDMGMPPVDMGMPPVDMGMPPVDMGMPPVDMGMPPVDMGMPPVDMGMPPVDMGMPPVDMGMPPDDMGAPPVDLGTTPDDMGSSMTDMGSIPSDSGTTSTDGAVRGTGVAPLSGTCSVSPGASGHGREGATILALLGAAALWVGRRKRQQ